MIPAMRYLAVITLLSFALAQPVAAQDFEQGRAAYDFGNYATALEIWRPLAERGNVEAQDALAFMYANGEGVAQNYLMAYVWFKIASENGSRTARSNLEIVKNKLSEFELKEAGAQAKGCLKNIKRCPE